MSVTKYLFEWTVKITLLSPFITSTDNLSHAGRDVSLARDWKGEKFIIPGSMLAGNIREIWQAFDEQDSSDLVGFLGRASEEENRGGIRKSLSFTDLVLVSPLRGKEQPGRDTNFTRIAVDQGTGSVKEGHLIAIEAPFPIDTECTFEGSVEFIGTNEDANRIENGLRNAACFLHAIGRNKTTGFGRVKTGSIKIDIRTKKELAAYTTSEPIDKQLIQYTFNIDRPMLVASTRIGSNYSKGSEIIPGSVIKGAVAEMLKRSGINPEESSYFSQIVFSHAFPSKGENRARSVPLSLAYYDSDESSESENSKKSWLLLPGENDWQEAELPRDAVLLHRLKSKSIHRIRRSFGWASPKRYSRTRTKITYRSGLAESEKLFVQQLVCPFDNGSSRWVSRVYFPPYDPQSDEDQARIKKTVGAILSSGLQNIGKTLAHQRDLELKLIPHPEVTCLKPGVFLVILQTDALMHSFKKVDNLRKGKADYLGESYLNYWRWVCKINDLSSTLLRNCRFVAEHRLAGGYAAYMRLEKKDSRGYYPYLLTKAGSVFVLETEKESSGQLQSLLEKLSIEGLPASSEGWLLNGQEAWKYLPFLPENGYGEICADASKWGEYINGKVFD